MVRWAPGAGNRLQDAAVQLFLERGYEQTTVADIAERAGVTARTFFRHYADKREVLFRGAGDFQAHVVAGLADAPADGSPMEAVTAALDAAADLFTGAHLHASARHAVITANPELRERELVKMAALSAALADGLRARGVPDPDADLAAETGVAVFRVAFDRWATGPADVELTELLHASMDRLRGLAT